MYTKLLDKQTKLALIGLGYVGLPIAMEFAKHVSVIGFDINEDRLDSFGTVLIRVVSFLLRYLNIKISHLLLL